MGIWPRGGVTLRALLPLAIALVAVLMNDNPAVGQQPKLKSVWDGVYSAAQAERGKMSFETFCADCHVSVVQGFTQKELIGPSFRKNWDAATADDLFKKISQTMPQNDRGSLPRKVYIDIIGYILQANGFPAGTEDLAAETMTHVQIAGKNGPLPLEAGATVRVIGCMAQSPDKRWELTRTAGVVKIKGMSSLLDVELAEADQMPLGTQTVGLDGDVSSAAQAGQKLAAKGMLIKTGPETRIRVVTLQMVNEACDH